MRNLLPYLVCLLLVLGLVPVAPAQTWQMPNADLGVPKPQGPRIPTPGQFVDERDARIRARNAASIEADLREYADRQAHSDSLIKEASQDYARIENYNGATSTTFAAAITAAATRQKAAMMFYQLLILLSLLSCQEKKETTIKDKKIASLVPKRAITKVLVKSVHFDITTFVDISCDVFDKQFPDAATTRIIDKTVLAELARHVALFKETRQKYPLDTRAKVFIYYSDNTHDIICMSKFRMVLNGTPIQYDKSLSGLLQISTE